MHLSKKEELDLLSFAHVWVKSLSSSDAISSIQASLSLWPLWHWAMSTISSTFLMQSLTHLLKSITKDFLLVCWFVSTEISPTTALLYYYFTHIQMFVKCTKKILDSMCCTRLVIQENVYNAHKSLIERTLQINEQKVHTHKWTKGKVQRPIWIKILKQFQNTFFFIKRV
jgi:hypothetical protein